MVRPFLIFLFFFLFLIFYIRDLQFKTIFVPFLELIETPSAVGLDFSEMYIKTSDGQLINAWFIPRKDAHFTVYFLHGNAGNLSHRLQKIAFLHELGLNVFIIDYRGYGQSSGMPGEKGLYMDAQAGYDYLTKTRKTRPGAIVVYGESLGSCVAVDLASKNEGAGLIAEGGFTSAQDMARRILPVLPSFLLVAKFDSASKIGKVAVPKLFIHSHSDEIVPYELGRKLFDLAPEPKYFLELYGEHNEAFFQRQGEIKEKMVVFFKVLKEGRHEKIVF